MSSFQTVPAISLDKDDEADNAIDGLERIKGLLKQLRGDTLACFSMVQQRNLANMLELTLELQQYSTLLDHDAIRYLACLHHVQIVAHEQATSLDYKSFVWAYHSKTQKRLVSALDSCYQNKMDWNIARKCGIFLWLSSHEEVVNRAEQVARQQFSGQDERDPTACSLLYYALRKHKLVANLWKQAFWHKDQKKMLAFLNNDFTLPRWQTAAFKNAFALLSQRRFGKSNDESLGSFFLHLSHYRMLLPCYRDGSKLLSLGRWFARCRERLREKHEGSISRLYHCQTL